MAYIDSHDRGTFCWAELATTDPDAAKAFYGGLFGWAPDDMPLGGGNFFTMLKLEGREIGALYRLMPQQQETGVPAHWLLYVATADVDDTIERVRSNGGEVTIGPTDVGEAGRMALFHDPQKAEFAVWQARSHPGAKIHSVPGTLGWSELATTDAAGARAFYGKVFDWDMKISQMGPVEYTEWKVGDQSAGGMLQMDERWGDVPPHWMPYFLVADCDASVANAEALGGAVVVGATDIPNVGRFAVLRDPQGAVFSIIRLDVPPAA